MAALIDSDETNKSAMLLALYLLVGALIFVCGGFLGGSDVIKQFSRKTCTRCRYLKLRRQHIISSEQIDHAVDDTAVSGEWVGFKGVDGPIG